MTKKDFEVIAEAIRSSTLWWISGHLGWTLAKEMADELEKTNPRFDRSKFIRACTPAGMDGSYIDLSNGSDSLIKKREIVVRSFINRFVLTMGQTRVAFYPLHVCHITELHDDGVWKERRKKLDDLFWSLPYAQEREDNMEYVWYFEFDTFSHATEAAEGFMETVMSKLREHGYC